MHLCLGLALWNGKDPILKDRANVAECSPASLDMTDSDLSLWQRFGHRHLDTCNLVMAFDWQVLRNQVLALALNLQIWFVRQVLRRPAPPLFTTSAERAKLQADSKDRCVCIEILGPGGVDQLRASLDSWAVCGYNLMKDFGSQRLTCPPKPLRPDLVVVRNKAFSINYADVCIRWGLYESALRFVGWPIVPGFDLAGEVELAGEDSGLVAGDRVFGCSFFGGYATRVVVPRTQLVKMPKGLGFEAAAALPCVFATALHAVHLSGAWPNELLASGRDALVHSAAGRVGDLLCQILRICGLRVVGVVGQPSKVKSCKADVVIDKSSDDWVKAARQHAPEGYRAIFDANGVATLKTSYELLGKNGRLVVYGFHSNLPKCDGGLGTLSPWNWLRMAVDLARTPRFDPMDLTLDTKAVLGFNLSFFADETETCGKYFRQMSEWLDCGKIAVPPVQTFGLSAARERLYGLSNPQGNHGEDVKELYYYLDAMPTHSYMKMMYKYPQVEYPYDELRRVNFERKKDPQLLEYELLDTGILDENKYFDVVIEYAQADLDDTLVQVTAYNRGAEEAELCLLPQAWFRNTWSWTKENPKPKPTMTYVPEKQRIELTHQSLGNFHLYVDETIPSVEVIFCENETNDLRVSAGGALSPYKEPAPIEKNEALTALGDFRCLEPNAWFGLWRRFGGNLGPEPAKREQETGLDQGFPHHLSGGKGPFKDGFHDYVIRGDTAAVSSSSGTKAGLLTRHKVAAGSHVSFRLRLTCADKSFPQGAFLDFDATFQSRRAEADRFYGLVQEDITDSERRLIHRQALAGMIWTKQLYYYDIRTWLSGDKGRGRPPSRGGRNEDWDHLYNADVISMPDKWEYPWYATWDLAFHCLPLALVDAQFAKEQLRLITLVSFMHPNGQFPAYEWNFNDVNPPVHAWAVWRVFQMDRKNRADDGDLSFLEELFHKLMLNFTWWVNRKDAEGRNIFQGGFLGLDNIGVVDRSQPFPNGGMINQSDGTSWMAFYSLTLMRMALELALHNPVYESIACKFLEHFLHIARAMTRLADNAEHGLWDPVDEFYYDVLANPDGSREPIKLRSIVGLIPLFAVEVLEPAGCPGFGQGEVQRGSRFALRSEDMLKKLPRFASQTTLAQWRWWTVQGRAGAVLRQWLFDNRPDLACLVSRFVEAKAQIAEGLGRASQFCHSSLAQPGRGERRMRALLKRMLDPMEFLSDYGVRVRCLVTPVASRAFERTRSRSQLLVAASLLKP
ncbi:unnamed protein product [Symbiodinium necroappetens]|uniref:Enoyl reductase (ER) domain-containing protein n=1 Tax=Symbiodinium necroappetens TaxID=1628268 RepID=A0A812WU50_9DINO|nr:unnamed protein product [Symbiodinium necroappetens]